MTEEKPSLQELEIRLKEQELKLKEVEISAKERESVSSKWYNPLVVAVIGAVIALVANVFVTAINNDNTQKLERLRNQSIVILEALKTNGDRNTACGNLIFFTSLGLIEDRNHTITGGCPGNAYGVPSISTTGPGDRLGGYNWYPLLVEVKDDEGKEVKNVYVEADLIPGDVPIQLPKEWEDAIARDKDHTTFLGVLGKNTVRCTTNNEGFCTIGMAPAGRFIAVLAQKEGYAANRTNTFFAGTSVVVILKKTEASTREAK